MAVLNSGGFFIKFRNSVLILRRVLSPPGYLGMILPLQWHIILPCAFMILKLFTFILQIVPFRQNRTLISWLKPLVCTVLGFSMFSIEPIISLRSQRRVVKCVWHVIGLLLMFDKVILASWFAFLTFDLLLLHQVFEYEPGFVIIACCWQALLWMGLLVVLRVDHVLWLLNLC